MRRHGSMQPIVQWLEGLGQLRLTDADWKSSGSRSGTAKSYSEPSRICPRNRKSAGGPSPSAEPTAISGAKSPSCSATWCSTEPASRLDPEDRGKVIGDDTSARTVNTGNENEQY